MVFEACYFLPRCLQSPSSSYFLFLEHPKSIAEGQKRRLLNCLPFFSNPSAAFFFNPFIRVGSLLLFSGGPLCATSSPPQAGESSFKRLLLKELPSSFLFSHCLFLLISLYHPLFLVVWPFHRRFLWAVLPFFFCFLFFLPSTTQFFFPAIFCFYYIHYLLPHVLLLCCHLSHLRPREYLCVFPRLFPFRPILTVSSLFCILFYMFMDLTPTFVSQYSGLMSFPLVCLNSVVRRRCRCFSLNHCPPPPWSLSFFPPPSSVFLFAYNTVPAAVKFS